MQTVFIFDLFELTITMGDSIDTQTQTQTQTQTNQT